MKPIKIEINENYLRPTSIGGVSEIDFKIKPTIRLGCSFEKVSEILKNKEALRNRFSVYTTPENMYESVIESLLTHETLHLAISHIVGWDRDTLDIVDAEYQISDYGIVL